jgi:uncharacterized membrane protein HdeD (DUF308 family)
MTPRPQLPVPPRSAIPLGLILFVAGLFVALAPSFGSIAGAHMVGLVVAVFGLGLALYTAVVRR